MLKTFPRQPSAFVGSIVIHCRQKTWFSCCDRRNLHMLAHTLQSFVHVKYLLANLDNRRIVLRSLFVLDSLHSITKYDCNFTYCYLHMVTVRLQT
jgi:hypothetical protein